MAGLYLLTALHVRLANITAVPAMLDHIVGQAFGLEEAVGGGVAA